MSVRVVVLRGAEADLRELRRYVEQRFGRKAWTQTLKSLRHAMGRIAAHPDSGRVPDELVPLGLGQYRQVLAGANRVIYERRADLAYVHLVCDARRDLKMVLMRRLIES
ncbi:type II toxin-antitoxin system RelE/ParE family toxin [Silanimonas lenta]|uniref:type II toxin-antitoxin system RelE/ParE family toxin n=1 Tax=Silanimonas lenta TaxID=265429 RepID=UPI002FE1DBDE